MDTSIWDTATPAPPRQRPVKASEPSETKPQGRPAKESLRVPDREMTMLEVEENLAKVTNIILETASDDAGSAIPAAQAKAAWLRHQSRVTVQEHFGEGKSAQYTSEALAHTTKDEETGLMGNELYLRYKILDNQRESYGRDLRAMGEAVSALQTVAANLRAVTTEPR